MNYKYTLMALLCMIVGAFFVANAFKTQMPLHSPESFGMTPKQFTHNWQRSYASDYLPKQTTNVYRLSIPSEDVSLDARQYAKDYRTIIYPRIRNWATNNNGYLPYRLTECPDVAAYIRKLEASGRSTVWAGNISWFRLDGSMTSRALSADPKTTGLHDVWATASIYKPHTKEIAYLVCGWDDGKVTFVPMGDFYERKCQTSVGEMLISAAPGSAEFRRTPRRSTNSDLFAGSSWLHQAMRVTNRIKNYLNDWQYRIIWLKRLTAANDQQGPLASVVITTSNRASYLSLLLSSLERQTVPSALWELLIIDCESQDDTNSVIKAFARRRKLQICHASVSKNLNKGAGVNHALQIVTSPTIILLDDDRVVGNDFILHHLIRQHSHSGLTVGLNTHALFTHLFSPTNQHVEGVSLPRMLSDRQVRDVQGSRSRLIQERDYTPLLRCCDANGMVAGMQKSWLFFDSANASFPTYVGKTVHYDEQFGTSSLADWDFAYRATHLNVNIYFAPEIRAHRQLMPNKAPEPYVLEVDLSRFRRKLRQAGDTEETIDDVRIRAQIP